MASAIHKELQKSYFLEPYLLSIGEKFLEAVITDCYFKITPGESNVRNELSHKSLIYH